MEMEREWEREWERELELGLYMLVLLDKAMYTAKITTAKLFIYPFCHAPDVVFHPAVEARKRGKHSS